MTLVYNFYAQSHCKWSLRGHLSDGLNELEERIVITKLSSSNHHIILVHGLLGMSHGIKKLNLPKETNLKLFQKMRVGIGVGGVKDN